MSIKNISLVVVGALILGVVGGFLANSIVVGILLPILLIVFYVMWKYMKSEPQDRKKEEEILEGAQTKNSQNIHSPKQPTYYQEPKDRV